MKGNPQNLRCENINWKTCCVYISSRNAIDPIWYKIQEKETWQQILKTGWLCHKVSNFISEKVNCLEEEKGEKMCYKLQLILWKVLNWFVPSRISR